MTCVACLQGFTWECRHHGKCGGPASTNSDSGSSGSVSDLAGDEEREDNESEEFEVRTQDDSKLKDQQSTGRKRAAKMYPLDSNAECEWRGKKHCGGGSSPITGCFDGMQQARHHGPDKNTLNNERGNVHRICHNCHNRWHSKNDEGYVWGATYATHNPVVATEEEIANSELYWMRNRPTKAPADE